MLRGFPSLSCARAPAPAIGCERCQLGARRARATSTGPLRAPPPPFRAARVLVLAGGLSLAGTGCSLFRPVPEAAPLHWARATDGLLEAGAAAVDITPLSSVWMGGFGILRASGGVHDPLWARALVLRRGALEMALVSVDLIGMQLTEVERIKARLDGMDPRHIVIAATHTHAGPDTLGLWGLPPFVSGVDEETLRRVEDGVLEALLRARARLRPAEVASGAFGIEPAGILKNIRRPGLVDRKVVVLHARDPSTHETIATLVELGCHPESLSSDNDQLSSDYPHWLRARVEEALGGTALFVSGALGAMVTADVAPEDAKDPGLPWREAERVGARVGIEAVELVRSLQGYTREPALSLAQTPVYIVNRNFDYEVARWTGLLDRVRYRWGYFRTEVSLWRVGALWLAMVPGELEPSLGLRLQGALARSAGGNGERPARSHAMVVSLANDELGYLLPASEFDLPIYAYERTLSPGYDAGDRLLRALEDLALVEAEGRGE